MQGERAASAQHEHGKDTAGVRPRHNPESAV